MESTNGFGSAVIFSTGGITQSMITGEVLDFKLSKQGEIKEATTARNNFAAVYVSKNKQVATLSVLLTTSGSAVALPNLLDTTTFTNPWSNECTGSWAVTGQPSIAWKSDDFARADLEITQWRTDSGTLP